MPRSSKKVGTARAAEPEYELFDTGVFAENRYFDVFVEYAQAAVDDMLMRITVHNRGPEAATLHVLPQLFFRNTWAWRNGAAKPRLALQDGHVEVHHDHLGEYHWYADQGPSFLFTDNETNTRRLYGVPNAGYAKDAFHERVVNENVRAVNPSHEGTKAAAWYRLDVPAGGSVEIRTRLAKQAHPKPFADFDATFAERVREADEFYAEVQHDLARRRSPPGAAPGVRRNDLEQAVLLLRRAGMAEGRRDTDSRRRRSASTAATGNGTISTTPTSSRCRTNGNTRGTPRGTSRFTRCRSR